MEWICFFFYEVIKGKSGCCRFPVLLLPLYTAGVLYQRGAVAEVGANINAVMPGGDHRTANTEGLVMRLRGDGKQYAIVLKTSE